MPRCRQCGRFFRTSNGFRAHLAMVRRTGRHYPSRRRGFRRRRY